VKANFTSSSHPIATKQIARANPTDTPLNLARCKP